MKYMGSKARFFKPIYSVIKPFHGQSQWVEPFVGGGNMIDKIPGKRWGNDLNKHVVALLQAVSVGWVPRKITKEEYQKIKNSPSEFEDYEVGFAAICCSYSGKYFGGFAGETKTKEGVRDYQQEAINNILKQAENLHGCKFTSMPFDQMDIAPNSLVYCDPPYYSTTDYKTGFDHKPFYKWLIEKSKTNFVFVSEYTCPPEFVCVWEKQTRSSLSANGQGGGSKRSTEKLFVHERHFALIDMF